MPLFVDVTRELPQLISENDLHLSQLTLNLMTSIGKVNKDALGRTYKTVLPQILHLICSPLLQGRINYCIPPPVSLGKCETVSAVCQ